MSETQQQTFGGLNVPIPVEKSFAYFMVGEREQCCELRIKAECGGHVCRNCIYSRYNYRERNEFFKESFKDDYFEDLYVPHEPEIEYTFCLGTDGCRVKSGTCPGIDCRYCIYSVDNIPQRERFFKNKFPHMWRCEICGEIHKDTSNKCEKETATQICVRCSSKHDLYRCEVCGKLHSKGINGFINRHNEDGTTSLVCKTCAGSQIYAGYFLCGECYELHPNKFKAELAPEYNRAVCSTCLEKYYKRCTMCGKYYRDPHGAPSLCGTCRDLTRAQVHYYSFKPSPIFNKLENEKNPIYFGVEFEIGGAWQEDADSAVEDLCVDDFYKKFYLKSDSSITEYGFELVTHPCTWEFHKKEFPWERVTQIANESGLCGTEDCGIHIHISRDALSEFQWLLFDYFINTNKSFWEEISGRYGNDYAQYTGKRTKNIKDHYGSWHNDDRYYAVNFRNENTVEVRTFQSDTRPNAVLFYIKHCYALVNFIKEGKYTPTMLVQKGADKLLTEFKQYVASVR